MLKNFFTTTAVMLGLLSFAVAGCSGTGGDATPTDKGTDSGGTKKGKT